MQTESQTSMNHGLICLSCRNKSEKRGRKRVGDVEEGFLNPPKAYLAKTFFKMM